MILCALSGVVSLVFAEQTPLAPGNKCTPPGAYQVGDKANLIVGQVGGGETPGALFTPAIPTQFSYLDEACRPAAGRPLGATRR